MKYYKIHKNKMHSYTDTEYIHGQVSNEPAHDKSNDLCAQKRLRSAWASTQSDQSSLCDQQVVKDTKFLHANSTDSDQTGWMPRLI